MNVRLPNRHIVLLLCCISDTYQCLPVFLTSQYSLVLKLNITKKAKIKIIFAGRVGAYEMTGGKCNNVAMEGCSMVRESSAKTTVCKYAATARFGSGESEYGVVTCKPNGCPNSSLPYSRAKPPVPPTLPIPPSPPHLPLFSPTLDSRGFDELIS